MSLQNKFGEWYPILEKLVTTTGFSKLGKRLNGMRQFGSVYPSQDLIFKSFITVAPQNVRVVFLGLEPYRDSDKATGVAYANKETELQFSPSLSNLFRGIEYDYLKGERFIFDPGINSSLNFLTNQGVMFLNACLTTSDKRVKGAHMDMWKPFTSRLLKYMNELEQSEEIVWVINDEMLKEFIPLLKGRVLFNYEGFDDKVGHRQLFTRINDTLPKDQNEICWALPF